MLNVHLIMFDVFCIVKNYAIIVSFLAAISLSLLLHNLFHCFFHICFLHCSQLPDARSSIATFYWIIFYLCIITPFYILSWSFFYSSLNLILSCVFRTCSILSSVYHDTHIILCTVTDIVSDIFLIHLFLVSRSRFLSIGQFSCMLIGASYSRIVEASIYGIF